MSGSRLVPELAAAVTIENAEEMLPEDWTTEEIGRYWMALTELSTLRLIRYKPELVKRVQSPLAPDDPL